MRRELVLCLTTDHHGGDNGADSRQHGSQRHRGPERVGELGRLRRSAAPPLASVAGSKAPSFDWKIAPVAATPTVPPTIRNICSVPDATPALSTATAFIAAVDIGDMVIPIPIPSRMKVGTSRRQGFGDAC